MRGPCAAVRGAPGHPARLSGRGTFVIEKRIGIIMHGVTGRMGTNQHLVRSILEIRKQGGVALKDGTRLMPDPILVGRNAAKVQELARQHGVSRWTTDLAKALNSKSDAVFFDAASTQLRPTLLKRAIAAGKHVYCEKPVSTNLAEALSLYRAAKKARVKHGVVQDKLWLPGLLKLQRLRDSGFFGKILSVRGEFGYWVFEGDPQSAQPPAQRPSWNYRSEDGGGIILDMLCHWRYVLDQLFGGVKAVSCRGATHIPYRWDENGKKYRATADDAAYASFELAGGAIAHFNSSWTVRVRRDDLLTLQVDGTRGSAVAGLRRCWTQSLDATPKPVWNPDIPQPINFFEGWTEEPDDPAWGNAFKTQWELFLRHVAGEGPFRWGLMEGARGVQLAELGLRSWKRRRWVTVPTLRA
jgi:predicted dehydrogenase